MYLSFYNPFCHVCCGLPISKVHDLSFDQLKNDVLIETIGQNVVLRSRQCSYSVSANEEKCQSCQGIDFRPKKELKSEEVIGEVIPVVPCDIVVKEDKEPQNELVFSSREQLLARIKGNTALALKPSPKTNSDPVKEPQQMFYSDGKSMILNEQYF